MNNKRRICITVVSAVLLMLLYAVIYSFSAQDAEKSGAISQRFSEKCVELIHSLSGDNWSGALMADLAEYFEHPIRKLAHFSEYACMGVLLYILWSQWLKRGRGLYALIIAWVFVSAAVDEFHQLFVPGRYGSFGDVLLDTVGGVFGLWVCVLAHKLRDSGHRKRNG